MWDIEDEERPEEDEPESGEYKVVHSILTAIFLWKAMFVISDAAISFILNSIVTIMDMIQILAVGWLRESGGSV